MQTRLIGQRRVSAIGLGAAVLALNIGSGEQRRITATIHAALDAGIDFIDTANSYAPSPDEFGYGERIIRSALSTYGQDTSHVLIATKVGHVRSHGHDWGLNGQPDYVRRACDASLRALGTDVIDLYQYHRPDPSVPYEDTIGALKELRESGKIRMIGISNANVGQIDVALEVLGENGLAAVQNEFSLRFRASVRELEYCAARRIAFLPWSPLGGPGVAHEVARQSRTIRLIAARRQVSAQQVCLAWMLHLAPNIVPIPGASTPETIRDSADAADLTLTEPEIASITALSHDAGDTEC